MRERRKSLLTSGTMSESVSVSATVRQCIFCPSVPPAGDASPHLLLDQREEKDLRDRAHVDDKGIIARRIMTAVAEAQAFASRPEREVRFRHVVRTLHLPRLRVTPEEYELEKQIPQHESGGTETAAMGLRTHLAIWFRLRPRRSL